MVQARMSSGRLPGKVLMDLGGSPILQWVVRAAQQSGVVDQVVVATSSESSDDPVAHEASRWGLESVRGSMDDVLDRFVKGLNGLPDETTVIRLTADCPLLDPSLIEMAVNAFSAAKVDYLSTIRPRSLPRGLDVEVMRLSALRAVHSNAAGYQRVHVTPAIFENPGAFSLAGIAFEPSAADLRVTVDTAADLEAVREIVSHLGNEASRWRDLVAFLRKHPEIVAINAAVPQKPLSEG